MIEPIINLNVGLFLIIQEWIFNWIKTTYWNKV